MRNQRAWEEVESGRSYPRQLQDLPQEDGEEKLAPVPPLAQPGAVSKNEPASMTNGGFQLVLQEGVPQHPARVPHSFIPARIDRYLTSPPGDAAGRAAIARELLQPVITSANGSICRTVMSFRPVRHVQDAQGVETIQLGMY